MFRRASLLIFGFVLCSASCKEGATETTIEPFDFPLSIGSTWTYATYDSVWTNPGSSFLSLVRDTVEVKIVGTTSLSNGIPATLWRYKYTNRAETLAVARTSDTVVFYSYTHDPMFIFPLKVGSAWGRQYVDTFTVTSQTLISLPSSLGAIIAYTAFTVDQQSLLPNDFSFFRYWLVPKVGIVRQVRQTFVTVASTKSKTSWELLSYSVVD